MSEKKQANFLSADSNQDQLGLRYFYGGAGRNELLAKLMDIACGEPALVVLSGEEGLGKTTICRLLAERVSGQCLTVFFSKTVESFDDVIRIIAQKIATITGTSCAAGDDKTGQIEELFHYCTAQDKRLLIIFDEAENIYLATLERIRKLLDRISSQGGRITILLAGRKNLLENIAQLSICDFSNNNQHHFSLSSLNPAEVRVYLADWAMRQDGSQAQPFSDEVVEDITERSQGNFRAMKRLAEEARSTGVDHSSFMTLLESVEEEEEEEQSQARTPKAQKSPKRLLLFGGVTLLVFVALFYWFTPESERTDRGEVEQLTNAPVIERIDKVDEGAGIVTPQKTDAPAIKPDKADLSTVSSELELVREQIVTEAAEGSPTGLQSAVPEQGAQTAEPETASVAAQSSADTLEVAAPSTPAKASPPLLTAGELVKRKMVTTGPQSRNIRTDKPAEKLATAQDLGKKHQAEKLYLQRVLAGGAWLSGQKDDKFTIQLMALAAAEAEDNFKQMLSQDDYRAEGARLFIFKKKATPEVLFVFYGEYDSMDSARQELKKLPEFLQNNKPYPIAIKAAVVKLQP